MAGFFVQLASSGEKAPRPIPIKADMRNSDGPMDQIVNEVAISPDKQTGCAIIYPQGPQAGIEVFDRDGKPVYAPSNLFRGGVIVAGDDLPVTVELRPKQGAPKKSWGTIFFRE